MNCEKHLKGNVIGLDCYNQRLTGVVSMTLTAIRADYDHVPCVIVYSIDHVVCGGATAQLRGHAITKELPPRSSPAELML